jgi:serine/threonine-protein kinase HipA
VVPTLLNLGYQAMVVGSAGAQSTLDNALTELNEFGIKKPRAVELIRQVAVVVDGWEAHFTRQGVCAADIELLRASIDRDALKHQRTAWC